MKRIINHFLNKEWVLNIVMRFLSVEKQEKTTIERLRQGFIFFGHDTANMTDDDIKEGVNNVAKTIGSFGATADEVETALRALKS